MKSGTLSEATETGLTNITPLSADIPEGYKPSITYKVNGRLVDAYNRPVDGEGWAQKAGVAGSKESKASKKQNATTDE